MLNQIKYSCLVAGTAEEGILFYVSSEHKTISELQELLSRRNFVISNKQITNFKVMERKISAGSIDLENTVVPFYEKIKDPKKKLTASQISLVLKYMGELSYLIENNIVAGRGLDAIKYYYDKLDKIYNKQKIKSEIKEEFLNAE